MPKMEDQTVKEQHPTEIVGETVVCRDGPSYRLPKEEEEDNYYVESI